MICKMTLGFLLLACLAMAGSAVEPLGPVDPLKEFRKRAAKFDSVVVLPQFELTANEISGALRQTIADANAALDRVAALKPPEVTFQNTVRALDDIAGQVGLTDNRLSLIKETSTSSLIRHAATDALKQLEEWMVGLDYREDVYQAVTAYAGTKPALEGQEAKLLGSIVERDWQCLCQNCGSGEGCDFGLDLVESKLSVLSGHLA